MRSKEMKMSTTKTARFVGAFFIIAMVTSLLGGAWLESIIGSPDYLVEVSAQRTQVVLGVLLELINGLCVLGIAAMMFPLLRRDDEGLALGYVAVRLIEAVLIVSAVISPLALIGLSQEYVAGGAADAAHFEAAGAVFLAARTVLAGQLLGIFFGLAALVFFYLLYRSKLVARFISVWGLIAAVSVLTWNLLETFGIHVSFGMILALPIILNEVFLGIWLIVKGFNSPALAEG
jgi:hypothetical protein